MNFRVGAPAIDSYVTVRVRTRAQRNRKCYRSRQETPREAPQRNFWGFLMVLCKCPLMFSYFSQKTVFSRFFWKRFFKCFRIFRFSIFSIKNTATRPFTSPCCPTTTCMVVGTELRMIGRVQSLLNCNYTESLDNSNWLSMLPNWEGRTDVVKVLLAANVNPGAPNDEHMI